jgi:hypothetical protein
MSGHRLAARSCEGPGYRREDMAMGYTIGLYQDSTRQGEITLDTLFVMEPADYTCEPKDVISHDEAGRIAKTLRREPEICSGVVGPYEWRAEHHAAGACGLLRLGR